MPLRWGAFGRAILTRYASQVRPLLTDEEFAKTSEVVAEFGQKGGIGQQLTAKLAELKAKTDAHTWDSSEFQSWLVRPHPPTCREWHRIHVCDDATGGDVGHAGVLSRPQPVAVQRQRVRHCVRQRGAVHGPPFWRCADCKWY